MAYYKVNENGVLRQSRRSAILIFHTDWRTFDEIPALIFSGVQTVVNVKISKYVYYLR